MTLQEPARVRSFKNVESGTCKLNQGLLMIGAADKAISASSLCQGVDGIELLTPRAEEQKH